MSNPQQQVFIQAIILTGDKIVTYNPLVIDKGTKPAMPIVPYTVPVGSTVGIFGGGNDDSTMLVGRGSNSCTNGVDGRIFGQVFFCNTHNLLRLGNAAISIPSLGNDSSGRACPTVRSFELVDQDQSDNVQTRYLVTPTGRTAQNTASNRASLPNATIIKNGSDNTLLSRFVAPAIGCASPAIPDVTDGGTLQPTQATNEIQAIRFQKNPIALVPSGDPMVGPNNLALLNAYRFSVLQPTVNNLGQANTQAYCSHLKNTAPAFFTRFKSQFMNSPSPDAAMNLFDFLVARYSASLMILGCKM